MVYHLSTRSTLAKTGGCVCVCQQRNSMKLYQMFGNKNDAISKLLTKFSSFYFQLTSLFFIFFFKNLLTAADCGYFKNNQFNNNNRTLTVSVLGIPIATTFVQLESIYFYFYVSALNTSHCSQAS